MSTNLLRNCLLLVCTFLLLCIGVLAYGNYKSAADGETADCSTATNSRSSEMPWEALAQRLLGAVSL